MKLLEKEGWEGNYFVSSNYGLLLVDSGAATSQLLNSEETAGLPVIRTEEIGGCLGKTTRKVVCVDRLCCGELIGEGLEVTLDDRLLLLGNDMLGRCCYTFDLRRMELTVIPPFVTTPFCRLGKRGHLFVNVELNGKQGLAMVDTGCAVSTMDREFAREALSCICPVSSETVTDSAGTSEVMEKILTDDLVIHGVAFPQQPVLLMDYSALNRALGFPIVATVGASAMALKRFSFNQKDGCLKIEDYE